MGGEERRKLIHEGLVNFQLDKGVSEQEAQQYADANIDQYAKRLPQGYSDWESALLRQVINRIITCLPVLATKIPVLSVLWDILNRRVFP